MNVGGKCPRQRRLASSDSESDLEITIVSTLIDASDHQPTQPLSAHVDVNGTLSQDPDEGSWTPLSRSPSPLDAPVSAVEVVTSVPAPILPPILSPIPAEHPRAYIVNSKLKPCARKHCPNMRMGFGSSKFCVHCREKCVKCGVNWAVKDKELGRTGRCRSCVLILKSRA